MRVLAIASVMVLLWTGDVRAGDAVAKQELARTVVALTFSRADWNATSTALMLQFAPELQAQTAASLRYEDLFEAQVQVYVANFSSAELAKLIRYYRTEDGQAQLAKIRKVENAASAMSLVPVDDDRTEPDRVTVQVKLPPRPRPRGIPVAPSY